VSFRATLIPVALAWAVWQASACCLPAAAPPLDPAPAWPVVPPPAQARLWADAHWLAPLLDGADKSVPRPEAVMMMTAILKGSRMGPGDGWFRPSQSRYDWKWLGGKLDADGNGRITRKEFKGPDDLFDRLDRDRDGAVTAEDFDWSPSSPFVRQSGTAGQWFQAMDTSSNGRISREEWDAYFSRISKGKDHLTPEDLRLAFFPSVPAQTAGKGKDGPPPAAMQKMLLANLLKGDLGSPYEGPRVGHAAPDFKLPTHDGTAQVSLSQFRGHKPVVLIFGNFT
jgi:Ca2+-binding EF-hand superfamily protein